MYNDSISGWPKSRCQMYDRFFHVLHVLAVCISSHVWIKPLFFLYFFLFFIDIIWLIKFYLPVLWFQPLPNHLLSNVCIMPWLLSKPKLPLERTRLSNIKRSAQNKYMYNVLQLSFLGYKNSLTRKDGLRVIVLSDFPNGWQKKGESGHNQSGNTRRRRSVRSRGRCSSSNDRGDGGRLCGDSSSWDDTCCFGRTRHKRDSIEHTRALCQRRNRTWHNRCTTNNSRVS